MIQCVLCGLRNASFVCHNCGRKVCRECFDTSRWWCNNCTNQPVSITSEKSLRLPVTGWLFFLAFIMIFLGIFLMTLAPILTEGTFGTSGGAVILIGPIPIILGSGPWSGIMVVLSLVVTVLAIILVGVILRRHR